jgi:crotonobetainyl-CoA:carnitine CoA-transferase CaiB-like acyl-CoA transferase
LTEPKGSVGGAHAGYAVYACKNGRVAVAALEPHFAARLAEVAGLPAAKPEQNIMLQPKTKNHLTAFFSNLTRKQVDAMAVANDLPLHTMA